MTERIIDADGNDIAVGARVETEYTISSKIMGSRTVHEFGNVTEITEMDGDVDEEGRSITIWPQVIVRWDGNENPEAFKAFWTGRYQDDDAPFQTEDLTVCKEREVTFSATIVVTVDGTQTPQDALESFAADSNLLSYFNEQETS